jgi:hypothetical protein
MVKQLTSCLHGSRFECKNQGQFNDCPTIIAGPPIVALFLYTRGLLKGQALPAESFATVPIKIILEKMILFGIISP